ncbi:MAG: glycosyltransferase family 4 protein [Euryarchaeota archaeon]|nr:glycosyltransferase family 4 protein [Euryarchaeota archaeon]
MFESDPDFSVAVVSTHDYGFERARNVLLRDARRNACGKNDRPGAEAARKAPSGTATTLEKARKAVSRVLRSFLLHEYRREFRKMAKDAKILRKAVKEFRPQVLFLQTLLYPCYLAFLMPRSIPVVITFWNGDVTWWATSNGFERLFKKKLVTYGVQRAKALTVNSTAAMQACLAYGVPGKKISLIRYPGVDRERFRPSSTREAREALGIEADKVILCPRGLGGYLNSEAIVESAVGVVKKHPGALFLFISGVGGGKVLEQHQERVKQLGLERNFRWDGQVPWERMPVYYNASDAMVSISSNDSLPNCMMEALACEVPVIMGDIPQIREWIADGENGFLVPPGDPGSLSGKILAVLELSPERIRRIAENGLELVARAFDSTIHTAMVKDLVRDVVNACSTPSG